MNKEEIFFKLNDSKLVEILNKYIKIISSSYIKNDIQVYEALYSSMIFSECYEFIINKDIANELIYKNMLVLKDAIENENLISDISLFGGLTEIALTVYRIHKSTGCYKHFLDDINSLLINKLEKYINNSEYNYKNNYDLDIISGISGIASYLLILEGNKELVKKLLKIIIPIIRKQLRIYKNDKIINLTMAHGICGQLSLLSKAYKKGIIVNNQIETINLIIRIYKNNLKKYNNIIYWPSEINTDINSYISNDYKLIRDGWCTGSISIARTLMIAADALNDNNLMKEAFTIIEERSIYTNYNYNLISPTLCHGYSGILSILVMVKRKYNNIYIEKEIERIKNIIGNMYDENSKYGFYDIEVIYDNKKHHIIKKDSINFLNGSTGVILALLFSIRNESILETHLLI